MWKALGKIITQTLQPETVLQQQLRTTFILKRRFPPRLHKLGCPPKKLRSKNHIYDLVKDTNVEKQPNIEVLLTQYVDGIGKKGQKVSLKPYYAYNELLLTGMAVYPTPEMQEKFNVDDSEVDDEEHSSPTAQRTVNRLSRLTLNVAMNKDCPWTLERWHIRNCFRRTGYHVPDEAITLPSKPIIGPNMDYEGKEFYVTVTINNLEQVKVRCILHHWATDILERTPPELNFFRKFKGAIFAEDADILLSLPSTISNIEKGKQ